MDAEVLLAIENMQCELARLRRALDADRQYTVRLLADGRAAIEHSRELLRRSVFSPVPGFRGIVKPEQTDLGS